LFSENSICSTSSFFFCTTWFALNKLCVDLPTPVSMDTRPAKRAKTWAAKEYLEEQNAHDDDPVVRSIFL
jgi:hypothetical protein